MPGNTFATQLNPTYGRENRLLFDVKDVEKWARTRSVCGLLHYFEGFERMSALDTFERARTICAWYLKGVCFLVCSSPQSAQDWQDAQSLRTIFPHISLRVLRTVMLCRQECDPTKVTQPVENSFDASWPC
jgi:hypothetical protein